MRRWPILVLLLLIGGCVDSKIVPLLGNWTGSFKVASVDGRAAEMETKPLDFKAYLQLYRTKDKFKMRMENVNQAFEMTGVWKRHGHQIELVPGEFKFENPSEDEQHTRGIKIVQPDLIRAAYGKALYLDLSQDEKSVQSPTMTLGNVTGRHFFSKGVPTDLAEQEYEKMRKNK